MSGEDVDAYVELKYEKVRIAFQNTRLNYLIQTEALIIIQLVIRLSRYINALFNTLNVKDIFQQESKCTYNNFNQISKRIVTVY